jgi:transcriptional regulator with XRE-family HTH domain
MIGCIAMLATANKIKALRQAHAMTQEDLVAKSGVSLATIQRAERGSRISAESLASIAAAFGVPASEIAAEEPGMFKPYLPLEAVTTGRQLVELMLASCRLDFGFSELDNLDDAKVIEAFCNFCNALVEDKSAMSPIAQTTREHQAKAHLEHRS